MSHRGIPSSEPVLCYRASDCTKDAVTRCGRCRAAWYCSIKCCKEHETTHRRWCTKPVGEETTSTPQLMVVPDGVYDTTLSTLRSGGKVAGVVIRYDELYDGTRGCKIVPETRTRLFTKRHPLWSVRDELIRECQGILAELDDYTAFYNGKRHRLYVVKRDGDKVVESAELVKLEGFMFWMEAGVVKWQWR